MQVVLLEKVGRFGKMGDVVRVKDGYARNFLLPRGKALRANKDNIAVFEARRAELEAENQARKAAAEKIAATLESLSITLIRQAGEDGRLYGSVTAKDIADAIAEKGTEIDKKNIHLNNAIKSTGEYSIKIYLHGEVEAAVKLVIAISEKALEEAANVKAAASVAVASADKPQRARRSKSKEDTGEDDE